MPFTEQNKPLLEEAASIDFRFMKDGRVNYRRHSKIELGLYFIKQGVAKHGNRFSYIKVDYKSMEEKVIIICKDHGEFKQLPTHHLKGSTCPKCSGKHSHSTEEFIQKAQEVHGEKYDYSHAKYKSSQEKVEIICPLHGSFFQAPAHHVYNERGCPKCSGHNHDILYLLKCLETGWYKIGITTNNTKKRMSDLGGNLEEIYHVKLEDPRKHESILHKRYAKYREYNLCVRDGCTEFFSLNEQQAQEVIAYMNEVSSA